MKKLRYRFGLIFLKNSGFDLDLNNRHITILNPSLRW